MTLSALLLELYRRTGYATSPAAEITTRFTAFLNTTQRQLLTKPGMQRLRDDTIPFASVASQAIYALPPAVAKIEHITDRTNFRELDEQSLAWVRSVDPGLVAVGGPSSAYIPRGYQPVAQQPSDASELFIKSTSASDGVGTTAYLEGIRTGGYPVTLSITMNGVTAKSFGAAYTDLIEVTKLYLSAAAVGTVTLIEDSGAGTVLATIPIGQLFARYLAIQLWPTPGSAITYSVDYVRVIPDLVNATDEPLLPEDFHWVLVEGALIKEWTKKDDTRRQAALQDYTDGVNSLRSWVLTNADTLASLRRTDSGWSQLGPMYPSGS